MERSFAILDETVESVICASATKWRHWSILIHREDILRTYFSTVLIRLPSALGYLLFTSGRESSYTTWFRRCPVLRARSAQNNLWEGE